MRQLRSRRTGRSRTELLSANTCLRARDVGEMWAICMRKTLFSSDHADRKVGSTRMAVAIAGGSGCVSYKNARRRRNTGKGEGSFGSERWDEGSWWLGSFRSESLMTLTPADSSILEVPKTSESCNSLSKTCPSLLYITTTLRDYDIRHLATVRIISPVRSRNNTPPRYSQVLDFQKPPSPVLL